MKTQISIENSSISCSLLTNNIRLQGACQHFFTFNHFFLILCRLLVGAFVLTCSNLFLKCQSVQFFNQDNFFLPMHFRLQIDFSLDNCNCCFSDFDSIQYLSMCVQSHFLIGVISDVSSAVRNGSIQFLAMHRHKTNVKFHSSSLVVGKCLNLEHNKTINNNILRQINLANMYKLPSISIEIAKAKLRKMCIQYYSDAKNI